MKLYAPSTIKEIKERYGFKISKSLGQNFLTDKNIIDRIIDATEIGENDLVLEIGPGLGVLTYEAAQLAGKVLAVEIDENLIPILKENLAEFDNVEIVNQDFLKTNLFELLEQNEEINGQKREGVKILGNLPYYITTPIIMKILEDRAPVDSITIMMQKEVADRIKSEPGGKTYGALSVAVQYYCEVVDVAKVPRDVFYPQPNVDSAVLRLDLRKERPVELDDESVFFACVKSGFGQRRKTLHNSLSGVCGLSKEQVSEALEEAGIDPVRRAETLDLKEFARLANAVNKRK
ncbi:MAG: 16S rRNA (adenine(1518)-N(6)/adenine(1519)-N(6))-dimethyltransferase RsmA [Clostridiales bacterium]|nr:16S rRNA (adenine(1518)-N(6)/adenine(1519)-N(6))-dimethyltransferase RsmA [Clostridiales bacterium]